MGSNMRPPRRAEDDAVDIRALVERHPIGGLILFNGHWPETRQTLTTLQAAASQPLLVMTDMERGLGQQAPGATLFPHQRAFGETGDEELVEQFGRAAAREALACGVHVALGPVVDVNRNPQNPIVSTRAFGEDTATVVRLATAFIRGARAEGLLTTAKHFPGHGNTAEDSHAMLPTVHDSREEIEREDLPPFRAAFDAGAELVMTAHVAYSNLDASGVPATLSRGIMTDLLRKELGFEGVVISDSLQMEGVKEKGQTEARLAVRQIAAGVDLLLDPHDPEAIIEGVAEAVASGELPEERLDEALRRVQRLRHQLTERFSAQLWSDPAAAVPPGEVASREHLAIARRAARLAIRVEGDDPAAAVAGGEGLLAVMLRSHTSPLDPPEQALGAALREALPGTDFRELGPDATEDALQVVREAAGRARAVLLAVVVKPAAWHAFGLPGPLATLARDIAEGRQPGERPLIAAALGDPRGLETVPGASVRIVTFSDTPVSQQALAAVLAGD